MIQVRYAKTEAELDAVYRLRYKIYVEELGERAEHIGNRKTDVSDENARHLMALDGEDLVGTLRIVWGGDGDFPEEFEDVYELSRFSSVVKDEEIVVFDRFCVEAQYRNTQTPFQLLAAISTFSLKRGVQLAFCDCQPHLLNLYLGLGFRTYTKTFNYDVVGLLVPLVFVCEDLDHLRKVGSPLLAFEAGHEFSSDVPAKIAPLLAKNEKAVDSATEENIAEWVQAYGLLTKTGTNKVSMFQDISEADMSKLLTKSHIIECQAGDIIIMAGRSDRTVFVLLSGTAEIRANGEVTGVRTEGDVIGELAFLLHGTRTADVVASSKARVLALNEKVLHKLQETEPVIAAQLMHNLARIVALKMVSLYQRTYS